MAGVAFYDNGSQHARCARPRELRWLGRFVTGSCNNIQGSPEATMNGSQCTATQISISWYPFILVYLPLQSFRSAVNPGAYTRRWLHQKSVDLALLVICSEARRTHTYFAHCYPDTTTVSRHLVEQAIQSGVKAWSAKRVYARSS